EIKKNLGDFQLDGAVSAGDEILALLGASGCGKSMTLKCIAGIERPDEGRIVLDGRVLFDSKKRVNLKPQKSKVGYLFQQSALFPNMTVEQNIAAGLRDKGKKDILPEVIRSMHLEGMEQKRPHQLSGGQQQRVALARILVNEPEVLMLDEPFSALDSHLRFRLEQEVRELARQFGKTVLLVSHDREEVYRLSDRIAILNDGHIEAVGDYQQVFRDPVTRNGAILTGCKNLTAVERRGPRRIYAVDWGVELTVDRDVGEDVTYAGIRTPDLSHEGTENRVRCRIESEIENPFSVTVTLQPCGGHGGEGIGWRVDKQLWQSIRADTVEVCLPPESILLLKES
ncbi:MAG: ABC transporter ATP-binding protein, partial [Oscillospiraceae bacterium]|nr:ABC transporter ATP-binding protein [Oscillospiraceae bacterium]